MLRVKERKRGTIFHPRPSRCKRGSISQKKRGADLYSNHTVMFWPCPSLSSSLVSLIAGRRKVCSTPRSVFDQRLDFATGAPAPALSLQQEAAVAAADVAELDRRLGGTPLRRPLPAADVGVLRSATSTQQYTGDGRRKLRSTFAMVRTQREGFPPTPWHGSCLASFGRSFQEECSTYVFCSVRNFGIWRWGIAVCGTYPGGKFSSFPLLQIALVTGCCHPNRTAKTGKPPQQSSRRQGAVCSENSGRGECRTLSSPTPGLISCPA